MEVTPQKLNVSHTYEDFQGIINAFHIAVGEAEIGVLHD